MKLNNNSNMFDALSACLMVLLLSRGTEVTVLLSPRFDSVILFSLVKLLWIERLDLAVSSSALVVHTWRHTRPSGATSY